MLIIYPFSNIHSKLNITKIWDLTNCGAVNKWTVLSTFSCFQNMSFLFYSFVKLMNWLCFVYHFSKPFLAVNSFRDRILNSCIFDYGLEFFNIALNAAPCSSRPRYSHNNFLIIVLLIVLRYVESQRWGCCFSCQDGRCACRWGWTGDPWG